jgi:diguanylate cyclase (GGDEF)-like protein/PAS domain S-box-containing protein
VSSGVVVGEYRHKKKDGTVILVSLSTLPMDYAGTPARIVLVHDITQRKSAEAALQRQLRFSHALNVIADTVVEQDDAERVLENTAQTVGRMLAGDRALIYDISFSRQQAEALCEWLNPACPGAMPTKATYPLGMFMAAATELRRTHRYLVSHADAMDPQLLADGAGEILHHQMLIKSLLWYPFAFRDDGYYLLVLNQIQQRREWSAEEIEFLDSASHAVSVALEKIRLLAERERVESDLRVAATAFEAKEGMMITDAGGMILRVNGAFTQITGYAVEEVIGQRPSLLNSGRHDAGFFAEMWRSLQTSGVWEGEIWNRRKDGGEYPESLTITAVRDKGGKITNYVGTFSDITESKAAADEIKSLAFFDPLTELPNRRLLLDRLQQALASSARSGREGALLFIDLDNFKTLNDTLGHDMGDLLLQQVARRLDNCVREGDTVARLGGDEFVVMLEGLSEHALDAADQTRLVGEKILTLLNQPYRLQGHEYLNTPSIGATLFHAHQTGIEELFKQADIAMYQSKKAGRNTLRFFDPQMQRSINARVALEHELRIALDDRQLSLHYQIQVDDAGQAVGAEALIRWNHPERGMVSPAQFIPLAEETGLILRIGEWVVDTACAQLKAWQPQGYSRHLVLSVNVSARQFRQAGFVEQVQAAVRRHDIDPSRLKLELTESLLLEDVASVIETMNALNEIGIQFSLDDFGTGYSSLQYLKRLPLAQLKIDQSFTRDIVTDASDQAIVRTIIAMAHSLNLDVIAEGVETEQQRQLLQNHGCRHYQGYLFGRPVPIAQFEARLQ